MNFTIRARFVVRSCGVDTDVVLRCDDPATSMKHYLAYSPSKEAGLLTGLDGMKTQTAKSELTVDEFDKIATTFLTALMTESGMPADAWGTVVLQARPGHELTNNAWDDETAQAVAATGFEACALPLKRKADDDVYFESAMVGGLMVRIDFWIALSIQ